MAEVKEMNFKLAKPYLAFFNEISKGNYKTWGVYDFFLENGGTGCVDKINVILRIDVDTSLGFSFSRDLASFLHTKKLSATFFFLPHCVEYNIYQGSTLKDISQMGFEVGIHSNHYYYEITQGKNALKAIKEDVKKISSFLKINIKGMTYHGNPYLDKIGKCNWDVYKNIPPKQLGLEYHDGWRSNYLHPDSFMTWKPNTDYRLSDFHGISNVWKYMPNLPLKILKKVKKGESIHVCIHPRNARLGTAPKEFKFQVVKKKFKLQVLFPSKLLTKKVLGFSMTFLAKVIILLFYPFIRNKRELLSVGEVVDSAKEIEKLYSKGINFWLNKIAEFGLNNFSKVLDVGCGGGHWSIAFSRVSKEVHSIEPFARRLQLAAEKAGKYGAKNITFYQAKAEELPLPNDSVDLVFCWGVLMFADSDKAFSEFSRVLKEQGVLFLTVDGLGYFLREFNKAVQSKNTYLARYCISTILKTKILNPLLKKDYPAHYFTYGKIKNLAEKYGFTVLDLSEESIFGGPKFFWGFPIVIKLKAIKRSLK